MSLPRFFVTCDPGSKGTGLAFFNTDMKQPCCTKSVMGSVKTNNWDFNRRLVLFQCNQILSGFWGVYRDIYIEKPMYMESHTGLAAARSESLIKLATFYGGLLYLAEQIGYKCHPVNIVDWKGQCSKEQTAARVLKETGMTFGTTHSTDAVGIGLYLMKKENLPCMIQINQ